MQQDPYVLVSPEGLIYAGLHDSEDSCWQIALGWPSNDEINYYKSQGYYVAKAQLTWRKP